MASSGKKYLIDQATLDELSQLKQDFERLDQRQIRQSPSEQQIQTPEVYIALSPPPDSFSPGGIPALIYGDIPGSALCSIYQLIDQSGYPLLVELDIQETVYNISTIPVPPGEYVLIQRDKFMEWIVMWTGPIKPPSDGSLNNPCLPPWAYFVWDFQGQQIGNTIEVGASLRDCLGNIVDTNWGDVEVVVSDYQYYAGPSHMAYITQAYNPVGLITEGEGTGTVRARSYQGKYRFTITSPNDSQCLWMQQTRNTRLMIVAKDDVYCLSFSDVGTGSKTGTGTVSGTGSAAVLGAWYCVNTIVFTGSTNCFVLPSFVDYIDVEITGAGGQATGTAGGAGGSWSRWNKVSIRPAYKVGDKLAVVGGTLGHPWYYGATLVVTSVNSIGQITAVSVFNNPGSYYSLVPDNPVTTTGGFGNGATFNVIWTSVSGGYIVESATPINGGVNEAVISVQIGTGGLSSRSTNYTGDTWAITSCLDQNHIPTSGATAVLMGVHPGAPGLGGIPGVGITFDPGISGGPIYSATNFASSGYFTVAQNWFYSSIAPSSSFPGGKGGLNAFVQPPDVVYAVAVGGGGGGEASSSGPGMDGGNGTFPNPPYARGGSLNGGNAAMPYTPVNVATATIVAGGGPSGDQITSVTAIASSGSGYPPSQAINVYVGNDNLQINAIINVNTDSSGAIVSFNSIVFAGSQYFHSGTYPLFLTVGSPGFNATTPGGGGGGGSAVDKPGVSVHGGNGGDGRVTVFLRTQTPVGDDSSQPTSSGRQCLFLTPDQANILLISGYSVAGPFISRVACEANCNPLYPIIYSISPPSGPSTGGTSVTITGTGFNGATGVVFGGTQATSFIIISDTEIDAISPAGSIGTVSVRVVTQVGTTYDTPADNFTYTGLSAPIITSISPTYGPSSGGTYVIILGTSFTGATAVKFGTTDALSFTVQADTQILATSPPESAGVVDVRITTPIGTSSIAATDEFTYLDGPVVTSISPTNGPITGGTLVTITGVNFLGTELGNGITLFQQGNPNWAYPPGFTLVSSTELQFSTPDVSTSPSPAGIWDVVVRTDLGTSPIVTGDEFTYTSTAPTVTTISPSIGNAATSVIITGTGFFGVTDVQFGTTDATIFTVNSSTTITAVSPTLPSGDYHVTVANGSGTSTPTAADVFTYPGAPTVTSVSPSSGPTTGGTPVVITGTGFYAPISVSFGPTLAPGIPTIDSPTQITTGTSASPAGTVDVVVGTTFGHSAISSADHFTFIQPPIVTGVSPVVGPTIGGTTVTISGSAFTGASAVYFGVTAAASYIIDSGSQIRATSPAHSAGTVDITVVNGLTSATSSADHFTFASLYNLNFTIGSPFAVQCVSMGDPSILRLTGAFSMSCWFVATSSQVALMGRWTDLFSAGGYLLTVTASNKLIFKLRNAVGNASQTPDYTVSLGTLYHAVATWDGSSSMKLYLNGNTTPITTATFAHSLDATSGKTFYLGTLTDSSGNPSSAWALGGSLDAARMYNIELTPTQVAELYNGGAGLNIPGSAGSNLIGWWKLDEGSGSSAVDSSTSGITGTLTNGPTYVGASILG